MFRGGGSGEGSSFLRKLIKRVNGTLNLFLYINVRILPTDILLESCA